MNSNTLYLIKKQSDTKSQEFKGKKYKIVTYEINKILLSCFGDKRFVLDDGTHTLAYFHKDLIFTDNHREKEILTYKKDSKRFS